LLRQPVSGGSQEHGYFDIPGSHKGKRRQAYLEKMKGMFDKMALKVRVLHWI